MSNEVKRIMHHKVYRQHEFSNDKHKITEFLKGINDLQINEDFFKITRILIRFYRFPVLVLFSPIYKRIELQKEKYLSEHQQELIKTAGLVRAVLKNKKFASLEFYFKAGCSGEEIQLKEDQSQEPFINFIMMADTRLNQRASSDSLDQDKKLKDIEQFLKKGHQNTKIALQKLCIEYYLKSAGDRRYQIQKQIALQKPAPLSTSKISTQSKSQVKPPSQPIKTNTPQQKQIQKNPSNDYLCCRSFFYENEIINQPQTLVQEYKNYDYPYDRFLGDILLKTICGFLNARGGIIYIGIKEHMETKKRVVVGQKYSQNAKQDLLKYFRITCEKIYPEIVNQQLYKLQFVPLKVSAKRNEWVPGKYVCRLRVEMGNQKELYSFKKSDGEQLFAFRTENEVLSKRMGQQIIQIYRKRLTSTQQRVSYIKHNGPCRPVQMGKQLCEFDTGKSKIELPWNNNSNNSSNFTSFNPSKRDNYKKSNEQFKRCAFACYPNALIQDLKKFQLKSGKDFWVFIQPRDSQEQKCIELIISKAKPKPKIIKISRMLEILNANMTYVETTLHNVLYNENGNNTISINSFDEVVLAIAKLEYERIDFNFVFSTTSF